MPGKYNICNKYHFKTNKSEYNTWIQIRARCYNPKHRLFSTHGAIGITVCDEWVSFTVFLADMGKRPSKDFYLCRYDHSKNYNKDNCRWIRCKARNPHLKYYKVGKIDLTLWEWAEYLGIDVRKLFLINRNNDHAGVEKYLSLLVQKN